MLCKIIVEWHHNTLSCISTEGQGSTFTIELPVAEASWQAVPATEKAHPTVALVRARAG